VHGIADGSYRGINESATLFNQTRSHDSELPIGLVPWKVGLSFLSIFVTSITFRNARRIFSLLILNHATLVAWAVEG
jgi:hypothetical protein